MIDMYKSNVNRFVHIYHFIHRYVQNDNVIASKDFLLLFLPKKMSNEEKLLYPCNLNCRALTCYLFYRDVLYTKKPKSSKPFGLYCFVKFGIGPLRRYMFASHTGTLFFS